MARGKEAFMGRRCHSPGVRRIGPWVQLVITAYETDLVTARTDHTSPTPATAHPKACRGKR